MPRANVGTLLENIVLVEVTKSLLANSADGDVIDFMNSFVMPPISEWRSKASDYGLDPSCLSRVSRRPVLSGDYCSLMAACHRYDSARGPNGALLFNLILRTSNRIGRFWLNDAPDENMRYTNEPFDLAALNTAVEAILSTTSVSGEVATCRRLFPGSLEELEIQLNNWRVQLSSARLGYLDPDQYTATAREPDSAHTDSASVRRFLSLLGEGYDAPVACVHFTSNQMKEALEQQIHGLRGDGLAMFFDVCVCRHGRYAVIIFHRNYAFDFATPIYSSWNSWCSVALRRRIPYALEINM